MPKDICEEIKSYCFYELVTGKTRILKKEIFGNIKNSRSQGTCPEMYDSDYLDELYFFQVGYLEGWPFHKIIQIELCFE